MPIMIRVRDSAGSHYYQAQHQSYCALDEALLRRHIPQFANLNEKARAKALKRFLRSCTVIDCGVMPKGLLNCYLPRNQSGRKSSLSAEHLRAGALALLSVGELFQNSAASFDLLADLLGGMWCKKLRAAEPDYQPVIALDSRAPQVEEILATLVRMAVPRKRWHKKHIKIRRKAVLDYRQEPWKLPRHFQDFSRCRVKVPEKGFKALRLPCSYVNTVTLIIGANSQQLQEASPYLQNAAVFLLRCASCSSLPGRRISDSALNAYDPQILSNLKQESTAVSHMLLLWWSCRRSRHVRRIVQAARASFGPQDSRYVSVTLDPKKLRQAIRHQLLLTFLDLLEWNELLTPEELAFFRTAIQDVYDPQPLPPQPVRRAEDREVFLQVMAALAAQASIVPVGEPYRKGEKCLGAWREISGVRYLVMPEAQWAKAYSRQVRMDKSIECGLFQTDHWERDFQKVLCEEGLIKSASSGYRYRYDIYGNGKRDSTYVVAVPESLLKDS